MFLLYNTSLWKFYPYMCWWYLTTKTKISLKKESNKKQSLIKYRDRERERETLYWYNDNLQIEGLQTISLNKILTHQLILRGKCEYYNS